MLGEDAQKKKKKRASMQAQEIPLPFGAMVSPGPFALLAEQLKDLGKNGSKESLRRKFS